MGGVVGICRCKDEADVIEQTVLRMVEELDALIVCDNASSDGTREILAELARHLPLEVLDDPDVGYLQAQKMTALAARAGQAGASWVVPFDADELWSSPYGRVAEVLAEQHDASIATAALFDHRASALDQAGHPFDRMRWRCVAAAGLPKVAGRPYSRLNIHQGNHDADHGARVDGLLEVRHFPYRSVEQFVSKVRNGAAAYAATDLPEHQGQHWRDYGRLLDAGGPGAIAELFRTWFWSPDPRADPLLIEDPAP